MAEYTPTTTDVDDSYVYGDSSGKPTHVLEAEFDRWYAAEKAKWQAEALRDAAGALRPYSVIRQAFAQDEGPRVGAYWLRDRADRIERGE